MLSELENVLSKGLIDALKDLYDIEFEPNQIQIQYTRKEFDGDRTIVVFPFLNSSPSFLASFLGSELFERDDIFESILFFVFFSCFVISITDFIKK